MNDFASAREKMVDSQLRTQNVTDYVILAAMGEIPREAFVRAGTGSLAYIDDDLLIKPAEGNRPARYLMEPAPFARLIQQAEIGKDDIVLDIGCGTGYSTAVLARLADSVVAIESDPELAERASQALVELEIDNAAIVNDPLESGYAAEGPYDAIVLEGSVEIVPQALFDQLKEGGRLVAVVGYGRASPALVYTKTEGEIGSRAGFDAHVRPLPGFRKPEAFVF